MSKNSKATVFTAFIAFISLLVVISLFFVISVSASTPGKWIEVCIKCAETKVAVPDGLAVTCEGMGYGPTTELTKDGCVLFGSGYVDGTYTIWWWWCGERWSDSVIIDCSKITWHFDYFVPNPTIIKHFEYASGQVAGEPVVGLEVKLFEYEDPPLTGTLKATALTDGTGTVTFGGDVVVVCKNYLLQYTWGGVTYTVPPKGQDPIHFAYDPDGKLMVCLWEETNYLEPKGGGDKKLHLAEWVE